MGSTGCKRHVPWHELPAKRMTKTQVIRSMVEQIEVPPKQIAPFLNLLIETPTTQTKKQGELTIPGPGSW